MNGPLYMGEGGFYVCMAEACGPAHGLPRCEVSHRFYEFTTFACSYLAFSMESLIPHILHEYEHESI